MYERRLLLDPSQSPGFLDEIIIDIECRFHTYQYGYSGHITLDPES